MILSFLKCFRHRSVPNRPKRFLTRIDSFEQNDRFRQFQTVMGGLGPNGDRLVKIITVKSWIFIYELKFKQVRFLKEF